MLDMMRQRKQVNTIASGNIVRGNGNIVRGSHNELLGDVNRVAGSKNSVSSNYVDVVGNNAEVMDDVSVLPDKGPIAYVNWRVPGSSSSSSTTKVSLNAAKNTFDEDIRLGSTM